MEERIARQNAEYEALTRAYERARDAEAALSQRAGALSAELGGGPRPHSRPSNCGCAKLTGRWPNRSAAMETARARAEDALRDSERHQGESRTLRDSLAAREATIAQVLHSLGERDAQLAALQQEHAKIVPVLEASSKSTMQLDAELQ